jgi:predicted RNA-binding protein with PUA-like domain
MAKHKLKTLPEHFSPTWDGLKNAELRKNDRDFKVGDTIVLEEWTPENGYTGQAMERVISHIVQDEQYLQPGYCLLCHREVRAVW